MDNDSFDLVIVGGGLAGMVAGARAAERGLRVAVLEKGTDPRYPCNTRWSGGIIHIAYTDPKEPEAALRAAIERNTRGFTDPALADVLVRETTRVIDWLRAQGGRFMRAGAVAWQNWMMAPPRPLVAGLDWQGRGPDVMLRLLADRLRHGGGTLVLGATGRTLAMQDGRCIGIEAEQSGVARRFTARAVVLADGGFQADLAMLRQHIMQVPEQVKQRGAATGAGDGLRMAREAGAAITALDCFYGHLLCRDSMVNDRVWPYPELDGIATAGIVVNDAGARIVDEGMGGIHMANMIARSSAPLTATVVFDTKILGRPRPFGADSGEPGVGAGRRHDPSRRDACRSGAARRDRCGRPGADRRHLQRGLWIGRARRARATAQQRPLSADADRDRAVRCHSGLRRHHLHDGRHPDRSRCAGAA